MTMKTRFASCCLLLAGLLTLVGCSVVPEPQADLTRYYALGGPVEPVAPEGQGLIIGLYKVQLADYLDKGSIVVRRSSSELAYNDYARWAEPLSAGITRLVRGRLLASPRIGRVFAEGFPFDQKRDYDVKITINQCEGVRERGTSAGRFSAIVEVSRPGENGALVARYAVSPTDTDWDGRDYGALVDSLSRAIADLGDQIVTALPAR